jgi:hypothetical protein
MLLENEVPDVPEVSMDKDTGQLSIRMDEPEPVVETAAEQIETPQESAPASELAAVRAELEKARGELAAKSTEFGNLKSQIETYFRNQQMQQRPQEQEFDLVEILTDKQKGPLFLQNLIDYTIQQRMGQLPQAVNQVQYKIEHDDFIRRHPDVASDGEIKADWKAVLKPILDRDENMTYEEAYKFVMNTLDTFKTAEARKPANGASSSPTNVPSTKPSLSDISEKAARLKHSSPTGTAGNLESKKEINSVKDAFEAAWATLYSGR